MVDQPSLSPSERHFRNLLRWYPRSWRSQHGDVLLGTLLDAAEAEGRTHATAAERRAAIVHGLGARLTRRLALVAALAALALSLVWVVRVYLGSGLQPSASMWWITLAVAAATAPVLAALSIIALTRTRGMITDGRALLVLLLVTGAIPLGFLTQVSWSVGFEQLDEGQEQTLFAALWLWIVLPAAMLGAIAIALYLGGLLERAGIRRGGRIAISIGGALAAIPVIGLALITGVTVTAVAVGAAVMALLPERSKLQPAPQPLQREPARSPQRQRYVASQPARMRARVLSWIACALATLGVVYAFTGSQWPGASGDSTASMGRGIQIALLATLPLLVAMATIAADRQPAQGPNTQRRARARVWAPFALLACSFVLAVVAYQWAPDSGAMLPFFVGSALLAAAAIAWWVARSVSGSPYLRAFAGILVGVGYAATFGVFMAPVLAFAVPIAAAAYAVWGTRGPKKAPAMRLAHAI